VFVLLKRIVYLAVLAAALTSVAAVLVLDWNR
jgi:hypothetical protein